MSPAGSGRTDTDGIGLLDAVAIQVGLIVGGALFGLVGVGVALAGSGIVASFTIAIGIAVLGLVPTAMMGAAAPTTCGHYRYPARYLSPGLAFLGAWGLGVSMFAGGLPLYALTAGEYLTELTPGSPAVVGLAILALFFGLNLFGIRLAAKVQLLMFIGMIGALGAFVGFGLVSIDGANLSPPFAAGVGGVLAGAGVLYFTCLGANFVIDIGGDVREATVTIPRSFAVSIPLVFALYVLVGLVAVGTVGVDAMAGETLFVAAELFLSPELQTLFVVGGATFAVATSLNAAYILVPRYVEALADDGIFPASLGATNDRYGTRHWALLATFVLSGLVMLAPLPFEDLGTLLGLGGAFVVTVLMLATLRVLRDPPPEIDLDAFPVSTRLVYWMAAAAVPLNLLLILLLATQAPWLFAGWAGLLAVGYAYYRLRMSYHGGADTSPPEHTGL